MSMRVVFNSKIVLPAMAALLILTIAVLPFFPNKNQSPLEDTNAEEVAEIEVLLAAKETHIAEIPDFTSPQEDQAAHSTETETQHDTAEVHDAHATDVKSKKHHVEAKSHAENASHADPDSLAHENEAKHNVPGSHKTPDELADVEPTQHGETEHGTTPSKVCYEIGPMQNDAQKAELEQYFRSLGMLSILKLNTVEKESGYWVFLPPQRSLAIGRLKVEEIKLKGLKDVNLLVNHEPKFAISLGIFREQKNAYQRMLKAQSLGFDARMDIRNIEENQTWLSLETQRENDLNEQDWTNLLQQYSPIELKSVNCP